MKHALEHSMVPFDAKFDEAFMGAFNRGCDGAFDERFRLAFDGSIR